MTECQTQQRLPGMLAGLPIRTDLYLCQREFIKWRKTHRKARINKKWRKRYGPVTACKGHGYQIAGLGIIGCPCFIAKLRTQVKE